MILNNIMQQLSRNSEHQYGPSLLHAGRTILPWHIEVLNRIKERTDDVKIGLIDNGSYVKYIDFFKTKCLILDWLDISCDGPEYIHNLQRDPKRRTAYSQMLNGFKHAAEIVQSKVLGGSLNALFTVTTLNYDFVEQTYKMLSNETDISTLHVTPMTPYHPRNFSISPTSKHIFHAFEQVLSINKQNRFNIKPLVFFKLYGIEQFQKFVDTMDVRAVKDMINTMRVSQEVAIFNVNGCNVYFYPTSLWPQNEFLIDADGAQRVAYSQKYTLNQLQDKAATGVYTVQQLSPASDYQEAHEAGVKHWWRVFGRKTIEYEKDVFQRRLFS
jgi:hypothetical protein